MLPVAVSEFTQCPNVSPGPPPLRHLLCVCVCFRGGVLSGVPGLHSQLAAGATGLVVFLVGAGLIFLTVIAYFLSEWLCECCRRWRQHKGHCSCSRRREVCTCLCIDKRSSTSGRSSSRPGRMCCWRKPAWAGACACDWILYPCPRVVSRRPTAANHGGTAAGTSTSAATDLGMVSPAQVGPLAQAHAGVPSEDFN